MMIAGKKRFGWGLGVSFLAHLLLFVLVAFFGGRTPATPAPEKEQVFAVEWVGGGGGGSGASVDPIAAPASVPPAGSRADNAAITDSRLAQAARTQGQASEAAVPTVNAQAGSMAANGAGGAGSGGGGGVGAGSGDGTGPGNGNGAGGSGSGVAEQPAVPPRLTKHVQPTYPEAARRAGQTGRALLRLLVSSAGRVSEVEVVQSSGSAALDDAASAAVERWRFSPAKDGLNRAVACYITVPVAFSLD